MQISDSSVLLAGKDVIQADATVIAGVLILMTIMSFRPHSEGGEREKVAKHLRSVLMGGSITIFSISAIAVALQAVTIGSTVMVLGFGFLSFLIVGLAITPYIPEKYYERKKS
jgi:hypothetical protein